MPPAKSSQDKFKFKFKFKSSQSRFSRYGVRPRVPDPAPAPRAPDERGKILRFKIHQKYEPPNPRGARGRMAGASRGGRGRRPNMQINLCPVGCHHGPCACHVCTTTIQHSCKRHLDATVKELSRLRVGEHLVRALDHKEGALGALVAVAVRVPLLGELVVCVFNLLVSRIRL